MPEPKQCLPVICRQRPLTLQCTAGKEKLGRSLKKPTLVYDPFDCYEDFEEHQQFIDAVQKPADNSFVWGNDESNSSGGLGLGEYSEGGELRLVGKLPG